MREPDEIGVSFNIEYKADVAGIPRIVCTATVTGAWYGDLEPCKDQFGEMARQTIAAAAARMNDEKKGGI